MHFQNQFDLDCPIRIVFAQPFPVFDAHLRRFSAQFWPSRLQRPRTSILRAEPVQTSVAEDDRHRSSLQPRAGGFSVITCFSIEWTDRVGKEQHLVWQDVRACSPTLRQQLIVKMKIFLLTNLALGLLLGSCRGECPSRQPPSATGHAQADDAGFYLTVSGNPETYDPGELYTISLKVGRHGQGTSFVHLFRARLALRRNNCDKCTDRHSDNNPAWTLIWPFFQGHTLVLA